MTRVFTKELKNSGGSGHQIRKTLERMLHFVEEHRKEFLEDAVSKIGYCLTIEMGGKKIGCGESFRYNGSHREEIFEKYHEALASDITAATWELPQGCQKRLVVWVYADTASASSPAQAPSSR